MLLCWRRAAFICKLTINMSHEGNAPNKCDILPLIWCHLYQTLVFSAISVSLLNILPIFFVLLKVALSPTVFWLFHDGVRQTVWTVVLCLVPLLNGLFVSWSIWIWGFRCELNCRSMCRERSSCPYLQPSTSGWPGLLRNFAETKCKCLSLHNYAWCSDHFHADMSNKSLVAIFIYRFNYRHSSQQGKRQKRGLLGEKALKKKLNSQLVTWGFKRDRLTNFNQTICVRSFYRQPLQ